MNYTDAEIKEMIIARRKAERAQKEHERFLTIKCWLCVGSLVAGAGVVWLGSWMLYLI